MRQHKKTQLFDGIERVYRQRRRHIIYTEDVNYRNFGKTVVNLDNVPSVYMSRDEYNEFSAYRRARLRIVRILAKELFTGRLRVVVTTLLTSTHPLRDLQKVFGWSHSSSSRKIAEAKIVLMEWLDYYRKKNYKRMQRLLETELTNADYRTLFLFVRCRSYIVTARAMQLSHTTVMRRLNKIDTLLSGMLTIKFVRDFWITWRRLLKLEKSKISYKRSNYGKDAFGKKPQRGSCKGVGRDGSGDAGLCQSNGCSA